MVYFGHNNKMVRKCRDCGTKIPNRQVVCRICAYQSKVKRKLVSNSKANLYKLNKICETEDCENIASTFFKGKMYCGKCFVILKNKKGNR